MEVVTLTILQDVSVLATGQEMANKRYFNDRPSSKSSNYSAVTLEVTPQESELLVFAQQMRGKLTLSLRHPSDNKYKSDLNEVNFKYLQTELEKINNYRQTSIRRNYPIK